MEGVDPFTPQSVRRMLCELMTEQQTLKFDQLNDIDFAYEVQGITAVFEETYFYTIEEWALYSGLSRTRSSRWRNCVCRGLCMNLRD